MDKRYYAFISYKREDEKQAKWLQDKLEHYRFPTNLNGRTDLPKNVRPIFRDVTDLTPGILAEEINKALNDSQWLIIVCSPRSAKSPWVCKEAQSFIDSGRADRIIPYVIEGVPFSGDEATECYPEALLNMKGNKELLAANVNEIGREAAAIKILARMFGLRFDSLWQRHTREQKKRRIIWGTIAAFMVVVSMIISGYFYWANNEIKEKQNKLLISQSKYLASEAKKEYDKGNITKALRMALYALPKDLKNMDRPYVPEAEIMLRECDKPQKEGIYNRSILQHVNRVNRVNSAQFSPDGKYIVTASDDNTARVWDAKTGEPVTEPLKHEDSVNSAQFSPDGKYIVTASYDYTARVWDAKTGEPVTESLRHEGPVYSAQFSPNGKYIVTASWEWDKTAKVWEFPPLEELIDKYRNDLEHDWSLTDEEKAEYSLE